MILQLNRTELLLKREEVLNSFQELITRFEMTTNIVEKEALKLLIEEHVKEDNEYSACKKAFWDIILTHN